MTNYSIAGSNAGAADRYELLSGTAGSTYFSIQSGLSNPGAHVFEGRGSSVDTALFQHDVMGADARTFIAESAASATLAHMDAIASDATHGTLMDYSFSLATVNAFAGINVVDDGLTPTSSDGANLLVSNISSSVNGVAASVQNGDFGSSTDAYSFFNSEAAATTAAQANAGTSASIVVGGDEDGTGVSYVLAASGAGNDILIGGNTNNGGDYFLNPGAGNDILIGGNNNSTGVYQEGAVGTIATNDIMLGGDNNGSGQYIMTGALGNDVLVAGANNGTGSYVLQDANLPGTENDTFVFNLGTAPGEHTALGTHEIQGFNLATDVLDFEGEQAPPQAMELTWATLTTPQISHS